MTRKDVYWVTCWEAISIFTSPAIARSRQHLCWHPNLSDIPCLNRLLQAQCSTDRRRCMISHDFCAAGAEVYRILVEVGMLCHERVLVIDGNTSGSPLLLGDSIAFFNAGVGGAVGSIGLYGRCVRPYQSAARIGDATHTAEQVRKCSF